jgi:D-alanine-D-alanine ligase
VLASAVGMDKVMMKVVFAARGLPICDYVAVRKNDWLANRDGVTQTITDRLPFPVFVKPANLGSSVGISKAKDRDELIRAIDLAAEFDRKIIVEAGVPDAREIECSVLGNDDPIASIAGEVIPSREFYDYEAKYLDDASRTEIPADLTPEQLAEVQRLSREAFLAIDGSGLARVDFLLSRRDGQLLLNEVNTLPGFTTISMYGKLWEASGLSYPDLLDRLVTLALERHAAKQQLRTSAI